MADQGTATTVVKPADHPDIPEPKIGVLLVNLGTPDAPTPRAVRAYLREFLSDPRVVELPRAVWLPILFGPILTFRPARSAKAYAKIWDSEANDSPLRVITAAQAEELRARLGAGGVSVDYAMRYGAPAIADRLQALKEEGCTRILLAPLYPQYSATTTASVQDQAFRALAQMRWQPAIRTLPPYYENDEYIGAVARSLEQDLATLEWSPDVIVASFHGLPLRNLKLGDPYHCQCQKTGRLLRERIGLGPDKMIVTFQSRFGRAEWLKPYTAETVERLAREGVKNIVVIAPGFAADCLETLEELGIALQESFCNAGGENFRVVPCLNASVHGMAMLEALIRKELAGWL